MQSALPLAPLSPPAMAAKASPEPPPSPDLSHSAASAATQSEASTATGRVPPAPPPPSFVTPPAKRQGPPAAPPPPTTAPAKRGGPPISPPLADADVPTRPKSATIIGVGSNQPKIAATPQISIFEEIKLGGTLRFKPNSIREAERKLEILENTPLPLSAKEQNDLMAIRNYLEPPKTETTGASEKSQTTEKPQAAEQTQATGKSKTSSMAQLQAALAQRREIMTGSDPAATEKKEALMKRIITLEAKIAAYKPEEIPVPAPKPAPKA